MTFRGKLASLIRGWFPQEPLSPNKQMKLHLKTNPVKLERIRSKLTINVAQLVAVVLSICLILGGLLLTSVSTIKGTYSLPINSVTYHDPVQIDGTLYNCSIHLFISPPLQESVLGPANRVNTLFVYLNEPGNISSGVYVTTLRYARYNTTLKAYTPEEFNQTGMFRPDASKKPALLFSVFDLTPPFEPGPVSLQPLVSGVVFTLYCNASNAGASSFTIETPINGAQSGYIIRYPYRDIGNIVLAAGILSLLGVFVISLVNIGRSHPGSSTKKIAYQELKA
ncbi:MAG: hypothetical protein NWE96_06150 [Candidatus Bathyarchaeota archaeon]|nr:hypothetical protein [Candidatus Bathyarchaeota archaeon]